MSYLESKFFKRKMGSITHCRREDRALFRRMLRICSSSRPHEMIHLCSFVWADVCMYESTPTPFACTIIGDSWKHGTMNACEGRHVLLAVVAVTCRLFFFVDKSPCVHEYVCMYVCIPIWMGNLLAEWICCDTAMLEGKTKAESPIGCGMVYRTL